MAINDSRDTGFFYESPANHVIGSYEHPISNFGAYQKTGEQTFNDKYNDLYESYKANAGIDIKRDIAKMVSDRSFMEQYKSDLMEDIVAGFNESCPNDPHIATNIQNVSELWDNKVKQYTESASTLSYLPISTLEFPVLVKQYFSSILKDIIDIETTKTPSITKHIRTTYLVDNDTGAEYEYPKCIWNGDWEKIWDAARGFKIKEKCVDLTEGKLKDFNIVTSLTDGTDGVDKLTYNLVIVGVKVGGEVVRIPGNGINVEFSTNGTLINGDLDFTTTGGTVVKDVIAGQVDFQNGIINLAAIRGQVEGVVFSGYLSNEKNMRNVSVREKRSLLRFNIEDGPRWSMPFSIEEIEDAAALLDINYYNRMVDEIVKTQELTETLSVIKWLNDEYDKYFGIATDIFKLESVVRQYNVDLTPPNYFAGDPFKYRSSVIQFKLKALLHQMINELKVDGLSFIIVGNPMATQLITEFVQWKTSAGSNIGGISVNDSYGFATDLGANVRVVATNMYEAYSAEKIPATGKRELVLHIYGYPTDSEHISFKHLKYTSHLFTSQSQTAYQSLQAPNGAYNIVTATSRYKNIVVQGIQARLYLLHSADIYGEVADRKIPDGAPWTSVKWPET